MIEYSEEMLENRALMRVAERRRQAVEYGQESLLEGEAFFVAANEFFAEQR
jgi:hypothetical protein